MSEQGKLPPTPSPMQLAKQKRELVNLAIQKGIFDKNILSIYYLGLKIDDINAITHVLQTRSGDEFIYKTIKFECACMESNYANCSFNEDIRSVHILSALGDIYNVYVKRRNTIHMSQAERIFACVLCKDIMSFNPGNFMFRCFTHMADHFTRKIIDPLLNIDKQDSYLIFKRLFIIEINCTENCTDMLYVAEHNLSEITEGKGHKSLQCMICNNIFISHEEYYILSHIWACSSKFINESPKICREDGFKEFLSQKLKLFFLKIESIIL